MTISGIPLSRNGCLIPTSTPSLQVLLSYMEQAVSTMVESQRIQVTQLVVSIVFHILLTD